MIKVTAMTSHNEVDCIARQILRHLHEVVKTELHRKS